MLSSGTDSLPSTSDWTSRLVSVDDPIDTRMMRSPSGRITCERVERGQRRPRTSRVSLTRRSSGSSCAAPSADTSLIAPGPKETSRPETVCPSIKSALKIGSDETAASARAAGPTAPRPGTARRRACQPRARRDGKRSSFFKRAQHGNQPFRSSLKNGQVIVGYLQDDQRHGRSVLVADAVVGPVSRRRLATDQFVANRPDTTPPRALRPRATSPGPHSIDRRNNGCCAGRGRKPWPNWRR